MKSIYNGTEIHFIVSSVKRDLCHVNIFDDGEDYPKLSVKLTRSELKTLRDEATKALEEMDI